jgi:sodium/pantothenate symporter
MDIYTAAIVISLVVYIAVGNYAGRRVKKFDDYFVAGRQAPTILIVGTLVASLLSTNAFLGETGFVYDGQAGPYLLWPGIAATFYIYGALFFGRYLRRSRALTVADFFGQRFNSQKVQIAAGITIILGLGGYLLAVTQGAAYLLTQVLDIDFNIACTNDGFISNECRDVCYQHHSAIFLFIGSIHSRNLQWNNC